MKIIRLQSENFKRLQAVDITPDGDLVAIGGDNAEGKTSVLDSIFAALGGAAAMPVKPVRTGEEYALIKLDLGDIKVTRFFGADGVETLKVENGEGASYSSPQTMLNKLVGAIAFDPLAFARMDPKAQAAELRRLVPLSVNLDDLTAKDRADMAARRDINRDEKAKRAQAAGIEISGIVPERPDRDAILSALSSAGETNTAIGREAAARIERQQVINNRNARVDELSAEIGRLEKRIAEMHDEMQMLENGTAERERELAELPALPELVNTAKLSDELAAADHALALLARIDERKRLEAEADALKARSDAYTKAMADRAALRVKALEEAEMPVDGLSIADFEGELLVTYQGEPFSQASGAQQLRVSMALAMAANPKLRVMLIKDGSLLDDKGLALVREMAAGGDYQVWLETVGERDGVGIIMEAGKVKGAPEPEKLEAPRRRKAKATDATETENQGDTSTDQPKAELPKTPGGDDLFNQVTGETAAPRRRRPPSLSDLTGGGE